MKKTLAIFLALMMSASAFGFTAGAEDNGEAQSAAVYAEESESSSEESSTPSEESEESSEESKPEEETSHFTDIDGHWGKGAIIWANEQELFGGTSATKFSPEITMTRGMFVTVLGRKAKIDQTKYDGTTAFTDVDKGEYYAPYVQWANKYDIVNGMTATTFDPSGEISREQMAAILYRYAKATEHDVTAASAKYDAFSDKTTTADWAKEAFIWATDKGAINGSSGKLDPKGKSSRAQVAQIMFNTKDILTKTDIKEPEKEEPGNAETAIINEVLSSVINPQRVERLGKDAKLTWDTGLEAAAKTRAQELTKSFSHTRPDGSNFTTVDSKVSNEIYFKVSEISQTSVFAKLVTDPDSIKFLYSNEDIKSVSGAYVEVKSGTETEYYCVLLFSNT